MALNFPAKIYQILENESHDVIRWHQNGAAFRIVDHGRFEREIIPKYFRHNQISSVQRQLNLYGFKCIGRGDDKGAFFHPKFRRGDWEEVKRINRYTPNPKKSDERSNNPLEQHSVQIKVEPHTAENSFNEMTQSSQQYVPTNQQIPRYPGMPLSSSFNNLLSVSNSSLELAHGPNPVSSWYTTAPSVNVGFLGTTATSVSAVSGSSSVTSTGLTSLLPVVGMNINSDTITSTTNNNSNSNAAANHDSKHSVKVVNDVVTIDPYFDFENEFDFLNDAMSYSHDNDPRDAMILSSPRITRSSVDPDAAPLTMSMPLLSEEITSLQNNNNNSSSSSSSSSIGGGHMNDVLPQKKIRTCEIGINTDLSQANMGLLAAELMFMFPRPSL